MLTYSADITIPDDAWQATGGEYGDDRSRLLAAITINGCAMHVEAFETMKGDRAEDDAGYDTLSDDDVYEALCTISDDGDFQTVEIAGREYVLVATAFC